MHEQDQVPVVAPGHNDEVGITSCGAFRDESTTPFEEALAPLDEKGEEHRVGSIVDDGEEKLTPISS